MFSGPTLSLMSSVRGSTPFVSEKASTEEAKSPVSERVALPSKELDSDTKSETIASLWFNSSVTAKSTFLVNDMTPVDERPPVPENVGLPLKRTDSESSSESMTSLRLKFSVTGKWSFTPPVKDIADVCGEKSGVLENVELPLNKIDPEKKSECIASLRPNRSLIEKSPLTTLKYPVTDITAVEEKSCVLENMALPLNMTDSEKKSECIASLRPNRSLVEKSPLTTLKYPVTDITAVDVKSCVLENKGLPLNKTDSEKKSECIALLRLNRSLIKNLPPSVREKLPVTGTRS
jgi:hypothetical protein